MNDSLALRRQPRPRVFLLLFWSPLANEELVSHNSKLSSGQASLRLALQMAEPFMHRNATDLSDVSEEFPGVFLLLRLLEKFLHDDEKMSHHLVS